LVTPSGTVHVTYSQGVEKETDAARAGVALVASGVMDADAVMEGVEDAVKDAVGVMAERGTQRDMLAELHSAGSNDPL